MKILARMSIAMKMSSLFVIVCSVQSTPALLSICPNVRYKNSNAAMQRENYTSAREYERGFLAGLGKGATI
jgi:hypothetical protein